MDATFEPLSVNNFATTKKYENLAMHPVQMIQENKFLLEEELKMQGYAHAFGPALPKLLTIERMVGARVGRLPGLKSSNMSLELAMNRLHKIDFEDYLNKETPDRDRTIPHLEAINDTK